MSLEALYRQKYDASVKQMKARCGCLEDAEDIVQTAFERAVRYEHTIRDVEFCFPFILKNCYNAYLNEKRDNGMVRSMSDEDENIPAAPDFDEDREFVLSLIKHKKGTYGEVLDLYFRQGFTQEEVGAIIGVKQQSVLFHLNKFKQELTKET